MADLFLVVDTGGSQTKIIYQTPEADAPDFFLMPPEVESISQQQFDRYQERIGWLGSPSPEQQAWFSVAEQLWVVGAFASEFDPQDRLREKKYENALYKVLAAIGVIIQKLGMTRRKVSVHLAMLLPWQEFNDRKAFESQIEAMMADFSFRGVRLKLGLKAFLCRPEGGGLAATRMRQQGLEWLQEQRMVVLLFGHRNTSALYFEYGQFKTGDSPLYGFSLMLDLLMARCSVLDRQALLLALVEAMQTEREKHEQQAQMYRAASRGSMDYGAMRYPNWRRAAAIARLVSVRDEALKEAELEALENSIEAALDEYWEKLSAWMLRVVPKDVDEVVLSGGAALLLQPKLAEFFDKRNKQLSFDGEVVWDGALRETMKDVFDWRFSQEANYARFADAYGLFDQLLATQEVK